MVNIGWISVSVGKAVILAVVGVFEFQRRLRGRRSGFPLQEERAFSQELVTLGSSLVVLGIVFGTDRLIGYSLIGAGVVISIISIITSKRKEQRSFMEIR